MADDERLREALLELEVLRRREAHTHRTTRALLDCIEAFTRADNPEAAMSALFGSLRDLLGAECSLVLRCEAERVPTVVSSDEQGFVNRDLQPPFDPTQRIRNLADLHAAGPWQGCDLSGFRSAMLAPARGPNGTGHALVCLRREGSFAKADQPIIARVAGLAVQAVAAKALAAENALLAATIQGSSSGFAIADATRPDRPLVYVNEAFQRLSGYSAAEVLGQNCRFLNAEPPDDPQRQRLRETVASNSSGRFLLRNRRKSGALFWNELALYPVYDAGGSVSHLVATQTDVTERVEARAERDRIQARMERALAATDDALVLLDGNRTVLYANAAMSTLFPVGVEGWAPGGHLSAYLDRYRAIMQERTDGPVQTLELGDLDALVASLGGREVDLADGRTALVRVRALGEGAMVLCATNITAQKSARVLLEQRLSAIEASHDGIAITDDDGRLAYLNRAAAEALGYASSTAALGRIWSRGYEEGDLPDVRAGFTARLRRRAGADNRHVEHEITASALPGGGAVIVLRDITERMATERREGALREALAQAQRREAVAQLAAGIAHDFNNLLSAITGSAHLISTDPTVPETPRGHAERINTAGERAARLINRLLDKGANQADGGAFDLGSALADVLQLVQGSLPDRIRLVVSPLSEPSLLRGDPDTLNQVLVNLLLNASDAIGTGSGEIAISACPACPQHSRPMQVGVLQAGSRYIAITVADTGPGMDADTAGRVFEAYFTTKGTAGTGLGLAMVATQLRGVGGCVDIASQPDKGTEVTLYWPCAEEDAVGTDPADPVLPADALHGMTLIIVDDEPEVSDVLQSYLERFGAEVSPCQEVRDAIEAVSEAPDAWSAIITDYDMPELSGGDLVEQVSKVAPDLPVFLVTALARRLVDPRVAPDRVAGIFAKPVDLAGLGKALAALRQDGGAKAQLDGADHPEKFERYGD